VGWAHRRPHRKVSHILKNRTREYDADHHTARCSGSEPMRPWSHEQLLRIPQ
jgi:hypothetical protein